MSLFSSRLLGNSCTLTWVWKPYQVDFDSISLGEVSRSFVSCIRQWRSFPHDEPCAMATDLDQPPDRHPP